MCAHVCGIILAKPMATHVVVILAFIQCASRGPPGQPRMLLLSSLLLLLLLLLVFSDLILAPKTVLFSSPGHFWHHVRPKGDQMGSRNHPGSTQRHQKRHQRRGSNA